MKRFLISFIALLIGGCASPLPQNPPAGIPALVRAPDVRVGDEWRYALHDGYTKLAKGTREYRVSGVQDDSVTVDVIHNEKHSIELYTRDWNWREKPMTNLQNFRYHPPYAALPFPLEAGKTWRAYVQATDPVTGRVNRVRIDGKIIGWERVKVPAGEFDALKIRRVVYAGNFDYFRGEDNIVEKDWYAPTLGRIVRHESSSEYTDDRQSCRSARCRIVKKDWNVAELVSYRRAVRRRGL